MKTAKCLSIVALSLIIILFCPIIGTTFPVYMTLPISFHETKTQEWFPGDAEGEFLNFGVSAQFSSTTPVHIDFRMWTDTNSKYSGGGTFSGAFFEGLFTVTPAYYKDLWVNVSGDTFISHSVYDGTLFMWIGGHGACEFSGTFGPGDFDFSISGWAYPYDLTEEEYRWASYSIDLDAVAAPVPEPTTMLLLGSGLIGLAGYGRKRFLKK